MNFQAQAIAHLRHTIAYSVHKPSLSTRLRGSYCRLLLKFYLCRSNAKGGLDKVSGKLHLSTRFKRSSKRNFIGKFKISAHRQTARNTRNFDT